MNGEALVDGTRPQALAIPDHELLRVIGSGAYGEVWLARNAVGTLRAVKIVRRDQHASIESFEREFKGLQKFEPVSRTHVGLVDVLTLGLLPEDAGFYYVMELADEAGNQCSVISNQSSVPGAQPIPLNTDHCSLITDYAARTLRFDLKSRGALPADEVIALGLKLTAALSHLHAQGLVHRDVKPSNILFIGGEPKLADAGLVAAMDDARSLVGTAGYIAPEGPGTPQADLYALGKVLYEAAFGKDRQDFPALPADVASRPDHARLLELNAILLKACATDRRERYQSADRMSADLELLEFGKSVREERGRTRLWALVRYLAVSAAMLTLLGLVVRIFWQRHFEPQQFQRMEAQKLAVAGWQLTDRQTKEGFDEAIETFHRAITLDPKNVSAYCGLSYAHYQESELVVPPRQAMVKALNYADRAVEVGPNFPDAYIRLAMVKMAWEWDWAGAEEAFKRAIALDPQGGGWRSRYADLLRYQGRLGEARKEQELAIQRAPKHLIFNDDYFDQLRYERRFPEALEQAKKLLLLNTNWVVALYDLGVAFADVGQFEAAIPWIQRARDMDDGPDFVAMHGNILARAGKASQARQLLDKLDQSSSIRYISGAHRAMIYVGLHDVEQAILCLEKDAVERTRPLMDLKVEPLWDELRSDARFGAILKRMGLEK